MIKTKIPNRIQYIVKETGEGRITEDQRLSYQLRDMFLMYFQILITVPLFRSEGESIIKLRIERVKRTTTNIISVHNKSSVFYITQT